MATTIRRLELVAQAQGYRETAGQVRQLAGAQGELTQAVQRDDQVQERAERRLAARQRVIRVQEKANYDLARSVEVHTRALEQGIITEARYRENVALERSRAFAPVQRIADRSAANADAGWGRLSTMGAANLSSIEANRRADQSLRSMGGGAAEASKKVALARHEMANLAYQVNDVATMLASGSSPFQVLATQAGQFIQIFMGAQGGVLGVIKQIGSFLLGLLTPVTLLVAAILAVGAAIAAFSVSGRRNVESLEDSFERHSETIGRVKDLYGDAAQGLRELAAEGENVVRALARVNEMKLREQLRSQGSSVVGSLGIGGQAQPVYDAMGAPTGMTETPTFEVASKYSAFKAEIQDLQKTIEAGTPNVLSFREAITARMDSGLLGSEAIEKGNELLEITKGLAEAALRLPSAMDAAGKSWESTAYGSPAFRRQMDDWTKDYRADKGEREAKQSYGFDLRDVTARTVEQRAAIAADRARAEALQDATRAKYADAAAERAASMVYAEARQRLADADRERALALNEQFAAAGAELAMIGQTVAALEEERFRRERLAEITRDELQNGKAWADQQRAAIEGLAKAWGALAQQTTVAKALADAAFDMQQASRSDVERDVFSRMRSMNLLQGGEIVGDDAKRVADVLRATAELERQTKAVKDLSFEREQLFRSDVERKIAENLRSMGVEADSAFGQYVAGVTRVTEALREAYDMGRTFATSLAGDLAQGTGFKEALGNASKRLGQQMVEQSAGQLFDAGWSALGAATGLDKIPGFAGKMDGSSAAKALWVQVAGMGGGVANLLTPGATPLAGPGNIVRTPLPRLLGATNDNTPAANAAPYSAATAGGTGNALSFVGNYRRGVDPRLTEILDESAKRSGYQVQAFSGFRPGDPRFHGKGMATDVRLIDPKSGKALPNYQSPENFRTYEEFAQTARKVQMERYPNLEQDFRWGGYFGGGKGTYGAMDTMHFDLGGRRAGMAGGSWDGGLTAAQRNRFPGATSYGMPANDNPQIAAANDNLTKFNANLNTSAQGLGTFGQGLGQFGQALGNGVSGGGAVPTDPTSIFGGLLGGGLGLVGKFFGFADGGWTGPGAKDAARGIVHADEVVFSKNDVTRHGGVGAVESLRRNPLRQVQPVIAQQGRRSMVFSPTTTITVGSNMAAEEKAALRRELDARDEANRRYMDDAWRREA